LQAIEEEDEKLPFFVLEIPHIFHFSFDIQWNLSNLTYQGTREMCSILQDGKKSSLFASGVKHTKCIYQKKSNLFLIHWDLPDVATKILCNYINATFM
jgi:hypothetical protein